MAISSKCPKCDHTAFELVEESPKGSSYKMSFIRCAYCGCVVGVTEYFNAGYLIKTLAKKLGFNI